MKSQQFPLSLSQLLQAQHAKSPLNLPPGDYLSALGDASCQTFGLEQRARLIELIEMGPGGGQNTALGPRVTCAPFAFDFTWRNATQIP